MRPLSVQSFKSKFENRFFSEPEGDHGTSLKNIVKIRYLCNKGPGKQTKMDFFITHQDLSNEYNINRKAIKHLETFPRERKLIENKKSSNIIKRLMVT